MLTNFIIALCKSKTFSSRRFWFFASTTFLGFIANSLAINIPFVVPFVIGNIAFLIILLRLGLLWSLLSLAIVCAPLNTDIVWYNSILQLICFMLFNFNQRKPWVRYMLLYSIAIGIIYYLFSYEVLTDSPAIFLSIVLLNCLIFLICVKTVLMLDAISVSPTKQKHLSLKLQLTHRIGLYSAVPTTILIAFILQGATSLHLSSQLQFYDREQDIFISKIQRHVERYISNTELVASLGRDNIDKNILRNLTEQQSEFISALVTNKNGAIAMFYKADLPENFMQNSSVADRSYFIKPRELNQSYVSETFQGRTIGQDLLFAVSSPIYKDGMFDGVVEISVDLNTLTNTLIADDALNANRILLDSGFKKIWGMDTLGELGEVWTERPLLAPYQTSLIKQLFLKTTNPIIFSSDSRFIVISKYINDLRWTTHFYVDTSPFVVTYSIYLGIAMLCALVLLQYVTVLAGRFIHNYTDTLEDIAEYAHRWNSDSTDTKPLTLRHTALDFEILLDSISGMQKRVIASRKAMLNSMKDVTLLNNDLENRVKERTLQLEEERDKAKQLAAIKTRFLANMSHEIRTPITIIKGFTEELLGETSGDVRNVLKRINQNTLHLQNVINDILDTAKIDEGKMAVVVQPLELGPFLESIAENTLQMAKQKDLLFDCDVNDVYHMGVMADPFRLQQILLNLLSNAVKFTTKGCITLKAEKYNDNTLTVKVIDQGIGMSQQQQQKLFQAFTQADSSTSRDYGGTGLGLYISKQLADAMNIKLSLSSELGKGSTFILTFKSILLPAELKTVTNSSLISPPPKTKDELPALTGKILIVDDVQDIRKLLASYLKKTNAKLVFAENGKKAIEVALAEAPDLIVMDQQMPVMDGFTAACQLRSSGFTSPIISLSADVFEDEKLKEHTSPFNVTLNKPINKTQLINTIATLLITKFIDTSADALLTYDSDNFKETIAKSISEEDEDEELRQDYLNSLNTLPEELALLIETLDQEGIAKLFHKVKGTSACLGLNDISDAATQAQSALKTGESLEEICRVFIARLKGDGG
ncbi:MAG: ATP-binding protein [Alishewanella sp.]|nr:ATP-binding protein [Alishewanella sp.]